MTIPIQLRRRNSGAAAPPASLLSGEAAYDAVGDVLYVGRGDAGSGVAASVKAIGGAGAFIAAAPGGGISALKSLSVAAGATGSFGGPWVASDISIGGTPTQGAGSGRLALRYDLTTDVAFIGAISPGSAWRPIYVQCGAFNLVSMAVGTGLSMDGNGNIGIGTSTPACKLDVSGPIRFGLYTVATLPAGSNGMMAFASNGRKSGEGAGAGTGVTTVFSNGAWRRLSDETAVVA